MHLHATRKGCLLVCPLKYAIYTTYKASLSQNLLKGTYYGVFYSSCTARNGKVVVGKKARFSATKYRALVCLVGCVLNNSVFVIL